MAELKFSLLFDKFTTEKKDFIFSSGIYIIYGESGVGKSHFLNSFIPNHEYKNNNFTVDLKTSDYESFLIDQNPDNQIVCRTVKSELSFNGECIQKTP
jgi:energy-coupling factor transporter ATP-binding protein EcfA2